MADTVKTLSNVNVFPTLAAFTAATGLVDTEINLVECTPEVVIESSFGGTSGYIKYNSGLLIQIGVVTSVPNASYVITFPLAFANTNFYGDYTVSNNNSGSNFNSRVTAHTTTSMTILHGCGTTVNTVYWIAVGNWK